MLEVLHTHEIPNVGSQYATETTKAVVKNDNVLLSTLKVLT